MKNRIAAGLAFILLAFAGGTAIDVSAKQVAKHAALTVYKSQYVACIDENRTRAEINNRVLIVSIQRSVLLRLIKAAQKARFNAYKISHQNLDLQAARAYTQLIAVTNNIYYKKLPSIDCNSIPKP